MATDRFVCSSCGYTWVGQHGYDPPTDCPCCKKSNSWNVSVVVYDSPEEQRAIEEADRKSANSGLMTMMAGAFGCFCLLPGMLLLMLLHTMVDIDSLFWNWVLIFIFTGVLLLVFKVNLIRYLIFDVCLTGIVTIIAWLVEDFTPWKFIVDCFNVWSVCIAIFLGLIIFGTAFPKLLDRVHKECC